MQMSPLDFPMHNGILKKRREKALSSCECAQVEGG